MTWVHALIASSLGFELNEEDRRSNPTHIPLQHVIDRCSTCKICKHVRMVNCFLLQNPCQPRPNRNSSIEDEVDGVTELLQPPPPP